MSSRNGYLTPSQRAEAPVLKRSLDDAGVAVRAGQRDPRALERMIAARISAESTGVIDYVEALDAEDLSPVTVIDRPIVVALAVKFGSTRLIDNVVLTPG
jgi:pantoate--beta-alanine ligase